MNNDDDDKFLKVFIYKYIWYYLYISNSKCEFLKNCFTYLELCSFIDLFITEI